MKLEESHRILGKVKCAICNIAE